MEVHYFDKGSNKKCFETQTENLLELKELSFYTYRNLSLGYLSLQWPGDGKSVKSIKLNKPINLLKKWKIQ